MKKRILVISTSLRHSSNSDELAKQFAQGAVEAGSDVEMIRLKDLTLHFCTGCMACMKTQRCVIEDDAVSIAEKVRKTDILVFATPVYYYGMSGQMKVLLDRLNPLYTSDYAFRDVYLLASAAEAEDHTIDGTIKGMQGWIDCFEHVKLSGVVFAGGVNQAGEIQDHPALKQAFELGKQCHNSNVDMVY